MENKKGKFIVIDGTDGSGKATQTKLLAERLEKAGFEVEIADFPQYGQKSAALVEEYLNGKYGEANSVGPYRASVFYSIDRYDASFKIRKWLNQGKIVISNRYVTANMGHQGGKISDPLERKAYFDWLYNLEYKIFNIPMPDLNIILHIDAGLAQKLVDNKDAREYIGGRKRDLHEADLSHLKNAEKTYLEIAGAFPDFALIECVRSGKIMSRKEINDLIWHEVIKLLGARLRELHDKQVGIKGLNSLTLNSAIGNSQSQIKVELLSPTAIIPTRAHVGDAGLDLYSDDNYTLFPKDMAGIKTGIKMQIPEGYVGLIWDKSGLAKQEIHTVGGVIDSGYRGEIIILVKNLSEDIFNIAKGQQIAQILIQKIESIEVVEDKINDETERGKNGFGSSGLS
ncbi:MAG: dUTP diphosphatase [Actinobacteria bacterium]|nr:dUTP diphosphatase [Actinomycetota bacterium]